MFATINYKGLWLEIIAMLMMVLASEFLVALSWLHCKKRALLSDNLVLKYLLPYLILLPVIFVFDIFEHLIDQHGMKYQHYFDLSTQPEISKLF